MSGVTMEMKLYWADETDWRYPEAYSHNASTAEAPISADLGKIKEVTGFEVMAPRLQEVALVASGTLGKNSQYYGDFSEAALATYSYGSNHQLFTIEQRRILNSNGPQMFIYPRDIRAYQKMINNGYATIVLQCWSSGIWC